MDTRRLIHIIIWVFFLIAAPGIKTLIFAKHIATVRIGMIEVIPKYKGEVSSFTTSSTKKE